MATLGPGSTISHYKIKSLISGGGQGKVYKAVDTRFGRVVAIKVPSAGTGPNNKVDDKARRRFMREAHSASILSHPNICTIFDVGEEDGNAFIVMEYVDGQTLKDILMAGPLSIEAAVGFGIQIADALEEAHRQRVIHRDLKPSNIVINRRGQAVMLDFGLAKRLREAVVQSQQSDALTVAQSVTTEASLLGTVAYMSPEQVRSKPVDLRSDIFSFGSLFYEMLCGEKPFIGASSVEIMHAVLHSNPRALSKVRPEIDDDLEKIVDRALHKQPADRYQTVTELKMDLWRYARDKGLPISGTATASAQLTFDRRAPLLERARRWFSWRRFPIWVAATVVLGLAIWYWWPSGAGQPLDLSRLRTVQVFNWKRDLTDGLVTRGRFSHDGRMIAFSSTRNGNENIFVQQLGVGEARNITTGSWHDTRPIWSHDGQEIAFLSDRGRQRGIWIVPFFSGAPELLSKIDQETEMVGWSRDGATIFYELNGDLFSLDRATSRSEQLTHLAPKLRANSFRLSPDEKRLVFAGAEKAANSGSYGPIDIWVSGLKGEGVRRVTNDDAEDETPVWHPDGRRIVFSSWRGNIRQLQVIDVSGRNQFQFTSNDGDTEVLDVSPDGNRVLCLMPRDEVDLYSMDLTSRKESRVTSEIGAEIWPDVSRDGRIAFQSSRVPSTDTRVLGYPLVTRSVTSGQDGKETDYEPQAPVAPDGFAPQWSPDGTQLAFMRRKQAVTSIWIKSIGEPRQLTSTQVDQVGFSQLPYDSEVARNFDWSHDGSQIAFTAHSGAIPSIMRVQVSGGSEAVID